MPRVTPASLAVHWPRDRPALSCAAVPPEPCSPMRAPARHGSQRKCAALRAESRTSHVSWRKHRAFRIKQRKPDRPVCRDLHEERSILFDRRRAEHHCFALCSPALSSRTDCRGVLRELRRARHARRAQAGFRKSQSCSAEGCLRGLFALNNQHRIDEVLPEPRHHRL